MGASSSSRLQPDTYNSARDGRSNWLAVTPPFIGQYRLQCHLYGENRATNYKTSCNQWETNSRPSEFLSNRTAHRTSCAATFAGYYDHHLNVPKSSLLNRTHMGNVPVHVSRISASKFRFEFIWELCARATTRYNITVKTRIEVRSNQQSSELQPSRLSKQRHAIIIYI